jgi:hypothetical protein
MMREEKEMPGGILITWADKRRGLGKPNLR